MTRLQLEQLDRDALIARAENAGVTRARILTRPELVDELLLRSAGDAASKRKARGLFGVARDLLARVVEQGLNLPDAAERIRALGVPLPPRRGAPAALPTVTLAEIYATQGHRDRAIETLASVLAREPDHSAAQSLLEQLKDGSYPVPAPRLPPEHEEGAEAAPAAGSSAPAQSTAVVDEAPREPFGMLDDTPLPTRYDVDECVAIPVDPTTLYVYWESRAATLDHLRASQPAGAAGALCLRIVAVEPTWDGPRSTTRDVPVDATLGDWFARDLPLGCVVRAAIGWKSGLEFAPIAHSPALETPPGAPSPIVADVLVRWTPKGTTRLAPGDPDSAAIERALGRVRREAARARQAGLGARGNGGSSEQWATAPWS
jgi:hypothetical protein